MAGERDPAQWRIKGLLGETAAYHFYRYAGGNVENYQEKESTKSIVSGK
jgi:hypothetical protein